MNIRIVSPSGYCDANVIDRGAETLRSWGHNVTIAAHAKGKYGRYSGTPEERAQDIITALKDSDVDLLYASRGGYGAMQILDKIPVELISAAKKPIFGYSDITALHALWHKAGVRSVHCHMLKHLGETPSSPFSLAVKGVLEKSLKGFVGNPLLEKELLTTFSSPIIGGNLAVLSGLHGTDYDFDYAGKILFIEDIKESPYKIDRMMQQLRLGGVFTKIKGLIVGQFTGCDEDPEMPKPLYETIRELVEPYKIPVWFDAPIGHVENNIPIIEGQ